ncbi:phosphatidylethanolamine-binding protein [Tricladium varicosporioides]|nr:phosphatidylethanolamine-binding protein [Hymenoscyphus varicosporioides]
MNFSLIYAFLTSFFISTAFSHGAGEEEPKSVSTADFKSSFSAASIVPDVLAAFSPTVGFYVGYSTADGDGAQLQPGMALTTAEAKTAPFEMAVEVPTSANLTKTQRFLVYMIGPDVPSRSNPTSRNVRHFLAANLTMAATNSSLLATAVKLTNSSSATNEYAGPAPSKNTGSHRYIYLLYAQPTALNSKSFASLGFNESSRTGFNLTAFRSLAGLGPSIGGTFFTIETDTNSTSSSGSGTSSSAGTSTATGTATKSSTSATSSSSASNTTITSGALREMSTTSVWGIGMGLGLASVLAVALSGLC